MEKAAAIIDLVNAGEAIPDISQKLNVPKTTIYYHIRKFKKTGSTARTHGSGKKRTKRTWRTIRMVSTRIKKDPFKSIRQIAREVGIEEKTARMICKQDVKVKSRARVKKHLINQVSKEKRLERSRKLLNILKDKKPIIFFTDEKVFDLDSVSNSRLDRYLSSKKVEKVPDKIRFKYQTKHPQSVMVFGLVASDGKKMDPFFWPKGTKINADAYIDVLSNVVKPWIEANYPPEVDYAFQQDGAPCHTANKTQKWLAANLKGFWPKDFWPPNSPDLNPLDYSVWAYVARDACKTSHPNLEALQAAITESWASMSSDYIRATCRKFRPRLEEVIAKKGGHIEH
jgi:inhibitor of nuclear factor kappa-B kinase subunit alpha